MYVFACVCLVDLTCTTWDCKHTVLWYVYWYVYDCTKLKGCSTLCQSICEPWHPIALPAAQRPFYIIQLRNIPGRKKGRSRDGRGNVQALVGIGPNRCGRPQQLWIASSGTYVCIYMYVCMYMYIYIYIYIYMHTHTHTCTYTYTHACMHAHIHRILCYVFFCWLPR